MAMERGFTFENFIENWNGDFPDYPMTTVDLKTPHMVMGALFKIFGRLGVDIDAVLAPPPEDSHNESILYYWDLLPVINMTRVINHIASVMPQMNGTISIIHFLQPMAKTSHSILLLMFNLMLFNEDRLRQIAPYEEELFAKTDQVKTLDNRKKLLLGMLNEQAEEKGKRSERLEKLDYDIKQFEEDLKQEKEVHEEEKKALDAILKENHQTEMLIEQKKSHRDALKAEVARKKALRVYDAEDIKSQAEQAAQNVQEAEEKLNSLQTTLMQKENSLKNLQTIKPSLDTANNLLQEIMKLSESLKDLECGDLESESKEGELEMLETELAELRAQLAEAAAARAAAARAAALACDQRDKDRSHAVSALREAEEKDKKCSERCKKAAQQTEHLKELTLKYEQDKVAGMEEIHAIRDTFCNELKSVEDALLKKAVEVEKRVEEKLRNRNI